MAEKHPSIVWLRRDLRTHDHAAFAAAIAHGSPILPVFVFDKGILKRFTRKDDPRISFIVDALLQIQAELAKHGGKLCVLHGNPTELIPALAKELGAGKIFCAEDYEPGARKRDETVEKSLKALGCELVALKDQVIRSPRDVLKDDGDPYKVFTPYSKQWRAKTTAKDFEAHAVSLAKASWVNPDNLKIAKVSLNQMLSTVG